MILIDSSVWIAFFNGSEGNAAPPWKMTSTSSIKTVTLIGLHRFAH